MNATISTLLCTTVLFALALDGAAQTTGETGRRRPVVLPAEGRTGPSVAPLTTTTSCFDKIEDQATGNCLQASSTPTFGMLFPYPGINNAFMGPAFVGGGEDNQATGPWSAVGGGRFNTASGSYATVGGGGGYGNYHNMASGIRSTVGGGGANQAHGLESTIGGGYANITGGYYDSGDNATVAGGSGNRAYGYASTIAGGNSNRAFGRSSSVGGGLNNRAAAMYATVSGGTYNRATGEESTVGGGSRNFAFADFSTIAGGRSNTVSSQGGEFSAIGGGFLNRAEGRYATVGGGGGVDAYYYSVGNTASGDRATIPGGSGNEASGDYSFAAGRQAMANHDGSFVWGDSVNADKPSSTADEFNVYASGGVRMFTNSAATTGAALAPGSGTWSMLSDRDAKENVEQVDAEAVLESVVAMPLSTWNYTEQADEVRHMGPMAQDFHAAFGLGVSDKLIDAVDSDGVALAAIQGLNTVDQELRDLLAQKDAEIAELRARLDRLEALAMAK